MYIYYVNLKRFQFLFAVIQSSVIPATPRSKGVILPVLGLFPVRCCSTSAFSFLQIINLPFFLCLLPLQTVPEKNPLMPKASTVTTNQTIKNGPANRAATHTSSSTRTPSSTVTTSNAAIKRPLGTFRLIDLHQCLSLF